MVFPFVIYGAAFVLFPVVGLAMGLVWVAAAVGLVMAVCLGGLTILKGLAKNVPILCDFFPDEPSPQEDRIKRLEAEEHASRVAALIEAEVSDAAAAAREALRPKSALEARALLGEARAEVEAAGGTLQVLELAAKAQNGGWLAVCEARERLGLAQAVLAEAEADAEPLLIESRLELAAEASDAKAVASEPRAAAAATGRAIERVVADRCLSAGEAPLLQAAFPKDFQSLRQGPPPSAAGCLPPGLVGLALDIPGSALSSIAGADYPSLFANLVDAGSKHITKDVFSRVMRVIFKVVKETPITKELAVAGDDTVRQLKLNEALELLKGPELEETMKVKRVHAKALSDGAEGWVTLAGNQGTAFLVENHGLFKVTRESHVYAAMEVGEDVKPIEGSRRLREGEVCEVISWPAKHEESGLMRMQVKAKLDSLTGWITQASKEGVAFAELL
ncbi:unnamed protein product [Polarella glacialis]|uniref:Uncharacterized protein n=1 Tax=Polarella glacialis TaxID=89957 RepID=A0A813GNB9_POLGL|nr:unnamed protein product [Polarella glacialis]